MKLTRPYVPLAIRCQVIARQLQAEGRLADVLEAEQFPYSEKRLAFMLRRRYGSEKVHLDHDPPLCLREIVDLDAGIYWPTANDPAFLTYRTAEEHRLKTFVRGDGAQLSDAGKRRKEIKRKRKLARKAPSRWPQGRKLQSRSSW